MSANETSAIATLRAVTSAEMAYASGCGQGGFATSLPTLGAPPPGGSQPWLPPDLTAGGTVDKTGYAVTIAGGAGGSAGPTDCNGTATLTAFYASATPLTYGTTGNRSFATNTGMTIWQMSGAAAPTEPFAAPSVPVQ